MDFKQILFVAGVTLATMAIVNRVQTLKTLVAA